MFTIEIPAGYSVCIDGMNRYNTSMDGLSIYYPYNTEVFQQNKVSATFSAGSLQGTVSNSQQAWKIDHNSLAVPIHGSTPQLHSIKHMM